jgi:hypothetical protein
MKTRGVGLVCFILAVMYIIVSCQRSDSRWKGTIEMVDGVTIVSNPKEPLLKESENVFTLSKELSIGLKEGPAEYMFSQLQDVDVDAEGNIYALDQREVQVRVYDAKGAYLRTIGRRGQGPGEFRLPGFVQITKQGELLVYDYAMSRASFFTPDGSLLRQETTRMPLMPLAMDSRGYFTGYKMGAPPPIGGKVLIRYDPDFQKANTIAQDEQGQPRMFDIGKPTIYGCVGPNDEIIWGNSEDYVLYFANSEGKITKKVRREYDPVPITAAEKKEFEEKYAEPLSHGMSIKFRNNYPVFRGIFVDENGHVLVKTYEVDKTGKGLYDVFDAEGRYLAKVTLKANLSEQSAWRKDKLYTIEMDNLDYPTVVRYRVTWAH